MMSYQILSIINSISYIILLQKQKPVTIVFTIKASNGL